MAKTVYETGNAAKKSNKKTVIAIVSVVALVAVIAGAIFIPQCFAPDFNVDGTYISEEGVKVVIKDDKISCDEIKELNDELELVKFTTEYARDFGKEEEMIRFYDFGEGDSIFIYIKDGKTQFGYGDYMFILQK